jgi:hypothetical protein
MKIKEIKRKSDCIYEVTFTPYWLEKLFGVEEKTKEYKDSGYRYRIDKSTVYIDKNGEKLGNGNWIGKAIDTFRRSW